MILSSTRRIVPLALRNACFRFSNQQLGSASQQETENAVEKVAENNIFFQDAMAQEQKEFRQFNEGLIRQQKSDNYINFATLQGKTPIILAYKAKGTWLPLEALTGVAWIAVLWQVWAGTASYATMGITAIAAIILSRESSIRVFKEFKPQITEIWQNQVGDYEIKYWEAREYDEKEVTVKPSQFKYNVGCDVNKWYSLSWKALGLHKWIPNTHQAVIWCSVDNQPFWISKDAQINNHHFHDLL